MAAAERRVDVARARRIELVVYIVSAVVYIGLGVMFTSKFLNWIVGPAYVIVTVSLITPQVLKWAGVADPDAGSLERWQQSPEGQAALAQEAEKAERKAARRAASEARP